MLARLIALGILLLAAPMTAFALPAVAVAAVGAAGSAWAAGAVAQTFFAVFAKSFAVSLVISALSGALARPRTDTGSSGGWSNEAVSRAQVVRSAIEPRRIVYGRVAVAGPLVFACTSGDAYSRPSIFLHLVVPLAGHEVEAIDEVWLDDEIVGDIDTAGNVTSGRFAGYVKCKKYLGTTTQTADTDLIAASGGRWTAAHRGRGVAYLYLRLTYSEGFWKSGIPRIRAVVRGKKVLDTRDSVTRYTENWALIVRDYLTSAQGLSCDSAEIDDTLITAAANVCDERVSLVYQPAFTTAVGSPTDDLITFAADQLQIGTGDAVRYTNAGGAAPGGLTSGSVYWYIRVSDTTGRLASSRDNALAGTAIDITTAGSGTHTLERCLVISAIDTGTDTCTLALADSRLQTGDGVRVFATTTLPTGISGSTTYYLIRIGETGVQLASSYANALARTAIDITGVGAGTVGLTAYDQARYTANGTVNLADKPIDIVQQLVTAAAGTVVYQQGAYRVYAGAYRTPSVQSDEDWLAGGVRVSPRIARRELYNGVRGTFVDPSKSWQPTDFPPVTNSTYETQDGSEQILRDIQLPFTTHPVRAQRIAKIHLEKSRQSIRVEMPCNMKAFKTAVWDTEQLTLDLLGWSDKVFQILAWRFDPTTGRVERVLQEEASSCYDWAAGDATLVDPAPNTQLPAADVIRATVPLNVSGLQIVGTDPSATTFSGRDCKFQWRRASLFASYEVGSELYGANDGSQDALFKDYQVDVYATMTSSAPLRTEFVVDPAYTYTYEKNSEDNAGVPLRSFVIKVRARTKYNQISAQPAVLKVNNPAPSAATVAAAASVKGLTFTFSIPDDTDFQGFKLWGSTSSGFTVNDSTLIYDGRDSQVVIANLVKGESFYYRHAATDVFGAGTTSDEASVSAGVLVLSSDLVTAAATEFSAYSASSGPTITAGWGFPKIAFLAFATDPENPSTNFLQLQTTYQGIPGQSLDIWRFDSKARYTQGTIVSASESGGVVTLVGSGTAWLSAGFVVGDIISLDLGYLALAAVASIIDDTHLTFGGFVPVSGYSGAYTVFKGSSGSGVGSVASSITASSSSVAQTITNFFPDSATSSDPTVTERIYVGRIAGRGGADPALTITNTTLQLFGSKK